MYRSLAIIAVVLVAATMALSLAHALELPGKMRLDKDTYLAVQKIYYPGFTIGGAAEPLGIIALVVLLVLTPSASPRFWWILAALVAMVVTHAIFWFVTQPVNSFWTKDAQLTGLAAMFFSLVPADIAADWSRLRDIWEYSHLVRSAFAMLSFLLLLIAVKCILDIEKANGLSLKKTGRRITPTSEGHQRTPQKSWRLPCR